MPRKRTPASITLFVTMPATPWTAAQARRYIKAALRDWGGASIGTDPDLEQGIVVHSVSFNTPKKKSAR